MPVEIVGEAGTPRASRKRINAEYEMAIKHLNLKRVCGEPPPEMELEIQRQEHDLGTYPLIVLVWEDATRGAPGNTSKSERWLGLNTIRREQLLLPEVAFGCASRRWRKLNSRSGGAPRLKVVPWVGEHWNTGSPMQAWLGFAGRVPITIDYRPHFSASGGTIRHLPR